MRPEAPAAGPRPVRFAVVGEAVVDLVLRPGGERTPGTFDAHPGGSPYNVAVALGRLGCDVALVARVGDDLLGRTLRRAAAESGVREEWLDYSPAPTGLVVADTASPAGARYDFHLGSSAALDFATVESPPAAVLHTGSVASWHPESHPHLLRLQRRARVAGALVSYDPNVRVGVGPRLADIRAAVERSVASAHLVKASEEDLSLLYPTSRRSDVARLWLSLGPDLVVVTCGSDGAVAYAGGGEAARVAAPPVDVADTIGAGDAFTAGLLAALDAAGLVAAADLWRPPAVLPAVLERAAAVAALACERPGASPPAMIDLRARFGPDFGDRSVAGGRPVPQSEPAADEVQQPAAP